MEYVLCMGGSKAPPVLYPSYSTVYVEVRTLYSTAHDNSDGFSLSYTTNKTGKMQSTINQLKHGKERAVRAIMVLGVVSIDYYCSYSTTFHALTNTYIV